MSERNELSENILSTINEGVIIVQEGDIAYANDRFLELSGYTEKEAVGKPVTEFIPSEYSETVIDRYTRRLKQEDDEPVSKYEIRMVTKGGEEVPVEINSSRIEYRDEPAVVTAVRDITQRVRRQTDLREQKEYTDRILDAIDDVFYILDSEGYLTRWNQSFSEVTGYTDDEIGSMHATEFFSDEDIDDILDAIGDVVETGTGRVRAPFLTKDSDEIPHDFVANRLEDPDGNTVIVGIGRDVTEQVEYERELERRRREREEEYESLYNSISDPVFVREKNGGFVSVNTAAVDKLGYSEDELLGMEPHEITDITEDELEELTRGILAEGERIYETYFVTRDDKIAVNMHSSVIEHRGDQRILCISRDISDLKDREKQLQVLDRILRHNMHNKMNIITGYSQALADSLSGREKEMVESIHDAAEDLISTTDKEKEIVDIISGQKKSRRLSIDEVIRDVVDKLRREYPDAEINLRPPDDNESTEVRAVEEIRKAIRELAENSVIHNHDDETPRVEIEVYGNTDKEYIDLSVSDNAPTISEVERDVLTRGQDIDPLYHGSGLGLWLVNWIVKKSGGELHFEENDPRGNTVTVSLPVSETRPGG